MLSHTHSERLALPGRIFFAAGIFFFGLQHLFFGDFVTRAMPPWPPWVPARSFFASATGAFLIATAVAIALDKKTRLAAILLAAAILVSALALRLPDMLADSAIGLGWTQGGKAFAFGGGALVIAATARPLRANHPRMSDLSLLRIGTALPAVFFFIGGVQHFLWIDYVHPLVPSWIPAPVFWSYFASVALIAGAIGLVVPATTRLAALLCGSMIFIWVWILHVPRAISVGNANEATAVFEAVAFSGLAFVIAAAHANRIPSAATPPSPRLAR